MKSPNNNQFGLIIAYLLPGFIGLAGLAPFVPTIAMWLEPLNQSEASLGPPVYAILAATTIGIILSCFRWIVIDHVLQYMGIVQPVWDDSRLEERLAAFNYLVESCYRYYQFVANTLIAIVVVYSLNRWMKTSPLYGPRSDLSVLILCAALFAAAHDSLSKYYSRTSRLIGSITEEHTEENNMYNGNHTEIEAGSTSKPPAPTTSSGKPVAVPKTSQPKDKASSARK